MEKEEHMTSEEKLLNEIRRKDRKASRRPKQAEEVSASAPLQTRKTEKDTVHFIKMINQIFVFGIVSALVYFGYRLLVNRPLPVAPVQTVNEKSTRPDAENLQAGREIKDFNYDRSVFTERDIFETPWERREKNTSGQINAQVVQQLPALNTRIRIAGIVVDQKTREVIVEKIKSKDIFFMKEGDEIEGAKLTEIRSDRAVFDYGGQKVELMP